MTIQRFNLTNLEWTLVSAGSADLQREDGQGIQNKKIFLHIGSTTPNINTPAYFILDNNSIYQYRGTDNVYARSLENQAFLNATPVTVASSGGGGGGGGGGDATAANQVAVQANAGANATKVVSVQGATGGKPIPVTVANPTASAKPTQMLRTLYEAIADTANFAIGDSIQKTETYDISNPSAPVLKKTEWKNLNTGQLFSTAPIVGTEVTLVEAAQETPVINNVEEILIEAGGGTVPASEIWTVDVSGYQSVTLMMSGLIYTTAAAWIYIETINGLVRRSISSASTNDILAYQNGGLLQILEPLNEPNFTLSIDVTGFSSLVFNFAGTNITGSATVRIIKHENNVVADKRIQDLHDVSGSHDFANGNLELDVSGYASVTLARTCGSGDMVLLEPTLSYTNGVVWEDISNRLLDRSIIGFLTSDTNGSVRIDVTGADKLTVPLGSFGTSGDGFLTWTKSKTPIVPLEELADRLSLLNQNINVVKAAVDKVANGQRLNKNTGETLSIIVGGFNQSSVMHNLTKTVVLSSTVDCWFEIGVNLISTALTTSTFLAAGVLSYPMLVTGGITKIAVRADSTAG